MKPVRHYRIMTALWIIACVFFALAAVISFNAMPKSLAITMSVTTGLSALIAWFLLRRLSVRLLGKTTCERCNGALTLIKRSQGDKRRIIYKCQGCGWSWGVWAASGSGTTNGGN